MPEFNFGTINGSSEVDVSEREKEIVTIPVKTEIPVAVPQPQQSVSRRQKPKTIKIPDFNALLKFCEKYLDEEGKSDDYEIEQFYKHTVPIFIYREKYKSSRGGGGWSGAVKATINILRKMKEKGEL